MSKICKSNRLKIEDIIKKLKSLECPFIDKEDAWVTEILFKPNFDRYNLMEWIFSKSEFNISKKLQFSVLEEEEYQNSSEVKMKNILDAISSLGLCSKDRSDIIEGVAPFKDQLNLWKSLVDIAWKKSSYSFNQSGAVSSSSSKLSWGITEQYEVQTKYINNLCKAVNFSNLFKDKLDVFPAYISNEIDDSTNTSPEFLSLQDLKTQAENNSNYVDNKEVLKMNYFEESEINVNSKESTTQEECVNELEEEISSSLSDIHAHATVDFNEVYQNLKLYLNVSKDESLDVGPSFETSKHHLNNFLKLKTALSTLKISESELKTLNNEMELQIPSYSLPDSLLREYMAVLCDKSKTSINLT